MGILVIAGCQTATRSTVDRPSLSVPERYFVSLTGYTQDGKTMVGTLHRNRSEPGAFSGVVSENLQGTATVKSEMVCRTFVNLRRMTWRIACLDHDEISGDVEEIRRNRSYAGFGTAPNGGTFSMMVTR